MSEGWAKLDQKAVDNLCMIAASFQRNKDEQTHLLFTLYHFTRDGRVNVGTPTLAKAAGVSRDKARYLIKKLESDGWLINEGTQITKAGEYTTRRWSWIDEGVGNIPPLIPRGVGNIAELIPTIRLSEESLSAGMQKHPAH